MLQLWSFLSIKFVDLDSVRVCVMLINLQIPDVDFDLNTSISSVPNILFNQHASANFVCSSFTRLYSHFSWFVKEDIFYYWEYCVEFGGNPS